ncbi:hypothetical protein B0G84_8487 [Paraburkholderia sp. BL8N3]|nr:hypothetical protein B0G84_8487 [Paraburkholderia sp. BL8N3]
MAVRAITAVRTDANTRRVTHVLWGHVSVAGDQFELTPDVGPVSDVVDALSRGDTVVTVFPVDGQRVAGPEVRPVQHEDGQMDIEAVPDPHSGRTLTDLPRLHYE